MADNKVKWNAEANEKILFIVLGEFKGKLPYDKIASELGVTATAVKSHLARVKAKTGKVIGANTENDDGDDDDEQVPQTPKKRKRAPKTESAGKASVKKTKVAKTPATVEEDDEEDN